MRDAREIIRLKSSSVSTHEIARRLGLARSTVRETLTRAETAGLSWPLPEGMNDEALERGHRRIEEPDWASVHRELKHKHVTLLILWDEYIAANPSGYSYSRFCELYQFFEKTLSVTMRQTHAAGERMFVDYAGDGVPVIIDRLTGEIRMAQIFVAVLGASSFTFAKASWKQALPEQLVLEGDRLIAQQNELIANLLAVELDVSAFHNTLVRLEQAQVYTFNQRLS